MSKHNPQSAVYRISINQQQLDQIVAAMQLDIATITEQVDAKYDEADVFFVPAKATLSLLSDLNNETPEDKARCHFGLCV